MSITFRLPTSQTSVADVQYVSELFTMSTHSKYHIKLSYKFIIDATSLIMHPYGQHPCVNCFIISCVMQCLCCKGEIPKMAYIKQYKTP